MIMLIHTQIHPLSLAYCLWVIIAWLSVKLLGISFIPILPNEGYKSPHPGWWEITASTLMFSSFFHEEASRSHKKRKPCFSFPKGFMQDTVPFSISSQLLLAPLGCSTFVHVVVCLENVALHLSHSLDCRFPATGPPPSLNAVGTK